MSKGSSSSKERDMTTMVALNMPTKLQGPGQGHTVEGEKESQRDLWVWLVGEVAGVFPDLEELTGDMEDGPGSGQGKTSGPLLL